MIRPLLILIVLAMAAPVAWATEATTQALSLITHNVGYSAIAIFCIACLLMMAEEFTHLRKSKPVIIAAGVIWAMIAYVYAQQGIYHTVEQAVRHNILEFAELMLFLLVAMTYINAMEERLVFESLRSWLTRKGFSYRQLFWLTGGLAFVLSPIADNLTTALLMGAVVMAVGAGSMLSIGSAAGCPHGAGARDLHLLQPTEMDSGHRPRLWREYPRSYLGERGSFLTAGRRMLQLLIHSRISRRA